MRAKKILHQAATSVKASGAGALMILRGLKIFNLVILFIYTVFWFCGGRQNEAGFHMWRGFRFS